MHKYFHSVLKNKTGKFFLMMKEREVGNDDLSDIVCTQFYLMLLFRGKVH